MLFIMVWSGLLIYWANHVFTITLFGHKFFDLFPDGSTPGSSNWFYPTAPSWWPAAWSVIDQDAAGHEVRHLWTLQFRLGEGLSWHFVFAWIFTINGLLYVTYLALSGEWRQLVPKWHAFREAIDVVLVDIRLKKGPLPIRKFNAAQQIAYTSVVVMGLLMVLTGIAIYKPMQQGWLTAVFGGYTVARFIHFWTTMALMSFFVVHVGQVIRTGWNNFRSMITGIEVVTVEEKAILEGARGSKNV